MGARYSIPPEMRRRQLERARGLSSPGMYQAPAQRTPIVVWGSRAWRPGWLLGWRKDDDGWSCHICYRLGRQDVEQFVVFDPGLILPVTIEDGLRWWLPAAPDGKSC